MKKAPNSTTRGVFVLGKSGKVEAVSPGVSHRQLVSRYQVIDSETFQGPAATVDIVRKFVGAENAVVSEEVGNLADSEKMENGPQIQEQEKGPSGDEAKAEVAAEVADSAAKLDEGAGV